MVSELNQANTNSALWRKCQLACKPGSVCGTCAPRGDHSSGAPVARHFAQPTRVAGPEKPERVSTLAPPLFGLAPGGVCHAAAVASRAVRSCRTFSPLPENLRRFVLCGTFPGVAPAGRYPAPFFRGARTFLHRGLSALAAAVTRPTGRQALGIRGNAVNKTLNSRECTSSAGTKARRSSP
jgi:hypothetical protein